MSLAKVTRKIDVIYVHCSATPPSLDIGVSVIRHWHMSKGWSDIGYHFVIRRNGVIEPGRDVNIPGAHVKGFNADSLGICLIGGVKEDNQTPDANFTFVQYKTLLSLLKAYPGIPVKGHRDTNPHKACPSFDIHELLRVTDYEG